MRTITGQLIIRDAGGANCHDAERFAGKGRRLVMVFGRRAYQLLWVKEQTTDAAERRIEAALNDSATPWLERVPLRDRLTVARSANTRARNKASKAYSELAAIRDRVRREQERKAA